MSQHHNQQQQNQQRPPEPPAPPRAKLVEHDEWTYVLTAGDEHDIAAARRWRQALAERSPESAPRIVQELKFARLTDRHTVIALYRPDGASELKAGPPVRVRDHWVKDGDDGVVNSQTFCGALAAGMLPAVCKVRRDKEDDTGTLRIGYA